MLSGDIERYIRLRRAAGYKLDEAARNVRAYARFATAKGDTHLKATSAIEWAACACSPNQRGRRLSHLVLLGKFLRAEDLAHEIPRSGLFVRSMARPSPYIYTPEELALLLETAGQLRRSKLTPLRPQLYQMLFGLIAATGLRASEALRLRFDDILTGGVLRIRKTKFNKSRLAPMHASVTAALDRYLALRRRLKTRDPHLFVGQGGKPIGLRTVEGTFARILKLAGIASERQRRPRIHDLRHTFATRVLQQCSTQPQAIARHFVTLSTYLGHSKVAHTYWYLEATPDLMGDIAALAEAFVAREAA